MTCTSFNIKIENPNLDNFSIKNRGKKKAINQKMKALLFGEGKKNIFSIGAKAALFSVAFPVFIAARVKASSVVREKLLERRIEKIKELNGLPFRRWAEKTETSDLFKEKYLKVFEKHRSRLESIIDTGISNEDKWKKIKKIIKKSQYPSEAIDKINKDTRGIRNEILSWDEENVDFLSIKEYSEKIIDLRNELDTIHRNYREKIFKKKNYCKIAECREYLNKAQTQLLKKCDSQFTDTFYEQLTDLWIKTKANGLISDDKAQFGKDLLRFNKKDPLILQALNNHFGGNAQLRVKKFYHHKITPDHAQKLAYWTDHLQKSYFYKTINTLLKCENIPMDPEKFLKLNPSHPIIKEAFAVCENVNTTGSASSKAPYTDESELFYSINTVEDGSEDPELRFNLHIGYEALCKALQDIQYSTNYLNREDTLFNLENYSEEDLATIEHLIQKVRERRREKKEEIEEEKSPFPGNDFSHIITLAKCNESFFVGNCGELAGVVFAYLSSRKIKCRYLTIKNHAYILIGEGPHQVVCDPWARIIYPANRTGGILQDCMERTDDKCRARLKPPSQLPEECTRSLPKADEFSDSTDLLYLFHHATTPKEQRKIARKILKSAKKQFKKHPDNEELKTIILQLNTYLYGKLNP